jgi:tetratricopeptide (TPR) repeat protein
LTQTATTSRSGLWGLAAVLAGWASLASKEVAAALCLVAPLFDRAFLATSWNETLRKRGWLHGLLLAGTLAMVWRMRGGIVGGQDQTTGFELAGITWWGYLRTQSGVLFHYLQLAFFPRRLVLDYLGWPIENDPWCIYGLGALLVAAFVGGVVWYFWQPRRGFLVLAFFLILAPTSSVLPILDLCFEHRMYLSLAALVAGVVLAVDSLLTSRLPAAAASRWRWTLFACVGLALGGRTLWRARDYTQPLRLFLQAAEFQPLNRRAHNFAAQEYEKIERWDDARRHYAASAHADPRSPIVWQQWGALEARVGDHAAAAEKFATLMRLMPAHEFPRLRLAATYTTLGKEAEAIAVLRDGLQRSPASARIKQTLAWSLATTPDDSLREAAAAIELARQATADLPHDWRAADTLAAALAAEGDYSAATAEAERALELARAAKSREVEQIEARGDLYRQRQTFRRKSETTPATKNESQP